MAVVFELFLESDDFRFQFAEEFFDLGFLGSGIREEEVGLLIRVIDEVEEFIGIAIPVVDELVGFGADAEVGNGVVMSGAVVVAVVEGLAPAGGGFTTEEGREATALHEGGDGEPGKIEESGGEVDVSDELVGGDSFADAGSAGEEGDVEAGLIHEAFVVESLVTEEPAVIGGVDDDGVF